MWKRDEGPASKNFEARISKSPRLWSERESFRHFWSFDIRVGVQNFFDQWRQRALATNLPHQENRRHVPRSPHRVAPAARGFRSFENYRIAILFHRGKLDLYPQ